MRRGTLAAGAESERVQLVVRRKNRPGVFDANIGDRAAIVVGVRAAVQGIVGSVQAFNVEGAGGVGVAAGVRANVDRRFAQHNQTAPIAALALAEGLGAGQDDRTALRAFRRQLAITRHDESRGGLGASRARHNRAGFDRQCRTILDGHDAADEVGFGVDPGCVRGDGRGDGHLFGHDANLHVGRLQNSRAGIVAELNHEGMHARFIGDGDRGQFGFGGVLH